MYIKINRVICHGDAGRLGVRMVGLLLTKDPVILELLLLKLFSD